VKSKVDRSVLEKDGVRQAVRDAGHGHLLMSDEEVAASLAATLATHPKGRPIWVFGYGGTPELPGLVLALDKGGSCQGVAYRMHDDRFAAELAILWRREMVAGTYMPKWINIDIDGTNTRAIAFVVNRLKPGYAGKLDDRQIVSIALRAHGAYGSCAEYLINTATSLEAAGIADPRLSRLARLVAKANPVPPGDPIS
jgi:cation transport protein ChaC